MAGERQLRGRSKDPKPAGMGRVRGGEHEYCLGEVELASDRLQDASLELVRFRKDGELVAAEHPVSEDVRREETHGSVLRDG